MASVATEAERSYRILKVKKFAQKMVTYLTTRQIRQVLSFETDWIKVHVWVIELATAQNFQLEKNYQSFLFKIGCEKYE